MLVLNDRDQLQISRMGIYTLRILDLSVLRRKVGVEGCMMVEGCIRNMVSWSNLLGVLLRELVNGKVGRMGNMVKGVGA